MRFAVARINFFDNDLKIKIVDATDWSHTITQLWPEDDFPTSSLEAAKKFAFDCECMIDVIEIPV